MDIPIKDNIKIEKNTIHNYKMTVTFLKKDYNQNENKNAVYSMKLSIVPKGNPNFALAATTDEGLYSMIDDSGNQSYYYRGVVENNYVKFGVDVQGNDMYWRIIRFNGDGSMRMQYDGKANGHSDTDFTYTRGFLLTSAWNTNKDDAKYVGWMFGGNQGEASTDRDQAQKNETDSDIKVKVDTWYKNTLLDNYHDYIADEIFCNDRSTPGKDATGWSGDTGLGYEKNQTGYGMSVRLGVWNENSDTPRFTCQQENDKFTVSAASGGNGKSKYPVGLITADEVMAAGSGKFGITNQSYYLYKGIFYWSLSPKYFDGSSANVFGEFGGLKYTMTHSSQSNAVLPVINIKPEYVEKMIGDGTAGNPYRLEI